jgi:outer membrane protein
MLPSQATAETARNRLAHFDKRERRGPRGGRYLIGCAAAVLPVALAAAGCAVWRDLAAPVPVPAGPEAWVPLTPPEPGAAPAPSVPPKLLEPGATVTLAEIVDIALANSPQTQASYHQARASAADLRSARGAYFPEVDANVTYSYSRRPTIGATTFLTITSIEPSVTLTYLLLDFGGRSATVEEARQSLMSADWLHNAAINDLALSVEQAYFQYLTVKAELEAARKTFDQATAGLEAATVRHDAGVGTIADVLQARTALAQAQLIVDSLSGQIKTTRGVLATAMGLSADLPLEAGHLPAEIPLDRARPAINALIADGRLNRPDLASARARAKKAAEHAASVRSNAYPKLSLQASASRPYYETGPFQGSQTLWSLDLTLSFPFFNGFSRVYDLKSAKEAAAVASAQALSYEQQVVLEVWTSYYALETATQRVKTSKVLLKSATESEQVAMGRYKEGVGTVLDLLSAQAALAGARAQEIQARSDWFAALAQLSHDTGRLQPDGTIPAVTKEEKKK